MFLQTGSSVTGQQNVNEAFAAQVHVSGGPNPFFCNSITGTLVAATNGDVFAMRLGTATTAVIKSIWVRFRCITAFTVPATFREFRIRRFTGTVASGGTAITVMGQKDTSGAVSGFNSASGGDARISATGALVSPGTPDTLEVAERIVLTDFGTALATREWLWTWMPDTGRAPLFLAQNQSLAFGTAAAFDAGGTFEVATHVEWFEGRKYG